MVLITDARRCANSSSDSSTKSTNKQHQHKEHQHGAPARSTSKEHQQGTPSQDAPAKQHQQAAPASSTNTSSTSKQHQHMFNQYHSKPWYHACHYNVSNLPQRSNCAPHSPKINTSINCIRTSQEKYYRYHQNKLKTT